LANELTQTTLEITSGEDSGKETFVFRIPSVREYAKVGARAHAMRAADSPTTNGSEWGLDPASVDLYRGMALFDVLLERADAVDNWPFTEVGGKPVVDSSKFPPRSTPTVINVARGFDEAYRRFLDGGDGDGKPVSQSPVGGQPNS
jgi:hypothetical protein